MYKLSHITIKTIAVYASFVSIIGTISFNAQANNESVKNNTVEVKNAWVRTSVQGQKATGAFMTLTAKDGAKLTTASSPVAGVVEVHEMKLDGDIMRMRALADGLDLPAGKAVDLKPGGYHVMLMDLKTALPKDSTIPLTLTFKDAKGVQNSLSLTVPVLTAAPLGQPGALSAAQHKH